MGRNYYTRHDYDEVDAGAANGLMDALRARLPGLKGEADVEISYEEIPVALAGGEKASIRKPTYRLVEPAYGPPDPELMLSPRVAPPMIGLGLVEAIHDADILALADPDDRDGDGVSGKPSMVRDPDKGGLVLGRFGWKASEATAAVRATTVAAAPSTTTRLLAAKPEIRPLARCMTCLP